MRRASPPSPSTALTRPRPLCRGLPARALRPRGAVAACLVLLSACGGGGDAAPPTAPSPAPTPAPTPVATVDVSPGSLTLDVAATGTLTATLRDATGAVLAGRTVAWTSAEPGVASVAGGVVTAVAPGNTTVTATSEGRSGTASVTVRPRPVASVTIAPDSTLLEVGATRTLVATLRDAQGDTLGGRAVTWSSSATTVATVVDGLVTAVAPGTAIVGATSEGRTGTATVVAIAVPVASVALDRDTATLFVGTTVLLRATPRAANGTALDDRPVTWSTGNPAVAGVAAGLVSAVAPGTAVITAMSEGRTATASITVRLVPVASVQLSPATATLGIGDSAVLTATPRDSTGAPLAGRSVTWTSSASTIATVVQGTVVGVAPGTATITATSEERSATATITVSAPAGPYAQGLGAGFEHGCVHRNAGDVWCWGGNVYGQHGNGTQAGRSTAGPMPGAPTFGSFSAGYLHGCALDLDGAAHCWGNGDTGRLGTGSTAWRFVPTPVATTHRFRDISASPRDDHTCAISTTDRLFCWGGNGVGQLGDGTTTARLAPVEVAGLPSVRTVKAGNRFTCATTTNGTSMCWGENTNGRLGDGTTTHRSTPVPIAGGHEFSQFATGNQHACGLRIDGVVLCWGVNANGELGDGTTTSRLTPAPIAGSLRFLSIAAGSQFTCGITTDRAMYCWGRNQSGQVGDGSVTNRVQPTRVQGSHAWWHVKAGRRFVCGVSTDGVYCWGENESGRLGVGDTTDRLAPTRVVGLP